MLDHMILTVSNVERSLAFYEAALKPLNIKFFLPYKGEGDHPDLWGFGDGKRAFFWIKQGKPDPASTLLLSHPQSSLGSAGEYVAKILLLTCCYQERSKAGRPWAG